MHCPVLRESSSGAETSRKAKARDSKGSQKRQQAWKLTLAAAVQDYSLGIVLPPVEHMKVCSQIRVFILQEVRLLLGGEAWDPVLVASAAGIPSKLCKITCSPATPALSTRAGGDNDGLGESPSGQCILIQRDSLSVKSSLHYTFCNSIFPHSYLETNDTGSNGQQWLVTGTN